MLFVLSACSENEPPIGKIEAFSYTNQYGEAFGTEELEGNVWIANFIFTNCNSVCPVATTEMATINDKIKEKGLDVTLVSFTVDPENDSPEKLKNYVDTFTSNTENWYFLTGYSQDEIELFASRHFKTIVDKPANSDQVIHGSNFYLIDRKGNIVSKYHYSEEAYMEKLLDDLTKLY